MKVLVNAAEKEVDPGATVAVLVKQLGLEKQPCAVEVNRVLVPKKKHSEQVLAEGDVVEIVTLVGGG